MFNTFKILGMKKLVLIYITFIFALGATLIINGCAPSEMIVGKSGAQLWGENCLRCHNAPDPSDYSDDQWEVVGAHMKVRVNSLSENEITKIVDFLKSAN